MDDDRREARESNGIQKKREEREKEERAMNKRKRERWRYEWKRERETGKEDACLHPNGTFEDTQNRLSVPNRASIWIFFGQFSLCVSLLGILALSLNWRSENGTRLIFVFSNLGNESPQIRIFLIISRDQEAFLLWNYQGRKRYITNKRHFVKERHFSINLSVLLTRIRVDYSWQCKQKAVV